jgi:transcriptional regulator with PAS, ATPase and Fis domain
MHEDGIQTSSTRMNELQQQLHQWHEVFLTAGYPTMILDDQYRIQDANNALLELIHCPMEDIQNKHCYTLFHGTTEPPPHCPCEVEITQGNSETTEMPVEQFNRFFLVSCKPLNIPGLSAPRYIHVATDVTEQRQFADKLQAINQQKELLIQELFHRTKNNMQMINSMLRLLARVLPMHKPVKQHEILRLKSRPCHSFIKNSLMTTTCATSNWMTFFAV